MINVNSTTKTAYLSDSIHKEITISFPDLDLELDNTDVDGQNIDITERVIAGTNIEFVGCMASVLHITLRNLSDNVSGQHIIVSMVPTVTGAESIVLFDGYVDQVKQVPHKTKKEITAYDILYSISNINVSDWYNNLSFPLTIKEFRDGLFELLDIEQEETTLVNDDITFDKDYSPTRLSAIDLIRSLCQINCVFGKITRDGTFAYINAPTNSTPVSQALTKYKASNTTYSEYRVKPVNRLIIRTGVNECYAGDGENKYIISENFFTKTLTTKALQTIANRLYSLVSGFSFQPINADINGLPYIECLDKISLPVYPIDGSSSTPTIKEFVALSRTMKGLQALRDNVVAEGNEYQHEFLSSVTVDIEELKAKVDGLVQQEFTSYELRNINKIVVANNQQERLLMARIASNTNTKAQIHIEVNLETLANTPSAEIEDFADIWEAISNTAVQGIITYLVNSEEVDFYPTETYIDGKHVLHLMYILPLEANNITIFEVYLRSLGGTITINQGGVWLYASGAGLVGDAKWDGTFEIQEDVENWDIIEVAFANASESVTTETQTPTSNTLSDTVSSWNVVEVTFTGASDTVLVETHTEVFRRVTEDGSIRVTEDSDVRYTEGD